MKVLITGAAGQVGTALALYLRKAYPNLILDGVDIAEPRYDVYNRFYQKSITSFSNIYTYDVIFHFASIVGPELVIKEPFKLIESNIIGLKQLMQNYPDSLIVYSSSSEVYGFRKFNNGICSELNLNNDLNIADKRSLYQLTKLISENLLHYHKRFLICRLFNIYGPYFRKYDKKLVSNIIRCIVNKEKFHVYGTLEKNRTLTYVNDAVRWISKLIFKYNIQNQIVNISSSQTYDLKSFINLIKRSYPDFKYDIIKAPKYDRTDSRIGDNRKMQSFLQSDYRETPLITGFKSTIDWYRKELSLS